MAQMRGMALALAALLLPAAAADGHTEHDRTTRRLAASTPILNGSHPYWIVSTSSSRKPNEGLYLSDDGSCCKSRHCSTSGGCYVRSDPFDRGKHMAFWIWPVPGEHDMFWLVGTSASSRPGHMAYLDWGFYGTTWVWPFHPDRPDSMSEWQFIPTAPSQIDDTEETKGFLPSHYYIVSGPRSRDPNKMLYLADDGLPPTRLPLPFGSIRTPQESQHAELGAEHADRERPGRLEAAASSVRRRPVLPGAVAVAVAAAAVAATTLAAANLAAASLALAAAALTAAAVAVALTAAAVAAATPAADVPVLHPAH